MTQDWLEIFRSIQTLKGQIWVTSMLRLKSKNEITINGRSKWQTRRSWLTRTFKSSMSASCKVVNAKVNLSLHMVHSICISNNPCTCDLNCLPGFITRDINHSLRCLTFHYNFPGLIELDEFRYAPLTQPTKTLPLLTIT